MFKKSLFFILFVSCFSLISNAQESNDYVDEEYDGDHTQTLTFELGPTISKPQAAWSGAFFDSRTGAAVSVQLGYKIDQIFTFRFGLGMQQKGGILNQDTLGNKFATPMSLRQNYLTLPLSFRAYFDRNQSFYIEAGAYFGYLLRSSQHSDSVLVDSKNYNKADIGFSGGMGFLQKISPSWKAGLEIQYNYSIDHVAKQEKYYLGNWTQQNFAILVGIQYTFPRKDAATTK